MAKTYSSTWGFVITISLDSTDRCVTSVTFDLGRYGILTKTIAFGEPVTVSEAVNTAECWFSERMTPQEHADLIDADDLFDCDMEITFRWEALGDCTFLEENLWHEGYSANLWKLMGGTSDPSTLHPYTKNTTKDPKGSQRWVNGDVEGMRAEGAMGGYGGAMGGCSPHWTSVQWHQLKVFLN